MKSSTGKAWEAGSQVVIEEKMEGEEASVFVLTDGNNYKILPVAQDHKAIFDNDQAQYWRHGRLRADSIGR